MRRSGAPSRTTWLPRTDAIVATLFVLAHAALLLSWPAVLGQDASVWITEGAALRDAFETGVARGCQLVTALPPNAFSQAVIGAASFLMPPWLAGRLYVVACLALFAAALVSLCRVRGSADRPVVLLTCLPLCLGYPFFHGLLNYMAALPVIACGIGCLLRDPEGRGVRGTFRLLVMPLLTYLCHGTALGIWAVLVGMQVLIRRSRGFAVRALLGFVPAAWLLVRYAQQRSGEGARVLWTDGSLLGTVSYRLRSPLRFTSLFPGFVPTFGDPALGAIAPLLTMVGAAYSFVLVFYGLRWAWRARTSGDLDDRWLSWSLLALGALFVVMPFDVANMLNPAERLVLPAVCLGAAGLSAASRRLSSEDRSGRWRSYGLGVLLLSQWMYLAVWGTRAAAIAHDFVDVQRQTGGGALVVNGDLVELAGSASAATVPLGVRLMTRHQSLQTQGTIEAWASGRTVAFPATGLFRCPAPRVVPGSIEGLRALHETLLLIGDPPRMAALAEALTPEFRVARNGPGFWTLVPTDRPAPRTGEN